MTCFLLSRNETASIRFYLTSRELHLLISSTIQIIYAEISPHKVCVCTKEPSHAKIKSNYFHPLRGNLWVHSLIQNQHHGVILFDRSTKKNFEETVCAHGLGYVTSQPMLRHQLRGLKPPNILQKHHIPHSHKNRRSNKQNVQQYLWIIEHVLHHSESLSHSDWNSGQYNLIGRHEQG